MPVRALGVLWALLSLAVGLTGCGSSVSPARQSLADYLKRVSAIERRIAAPVQQIDQLTQALAHPSRTGAKGTVAGLHAAPSLQAAELRRAGAQIAMAGAQLRALAVPPPDRRLQAMLLELIRLQTDLAEQSARLILFAPAFHAVLVPLGPSITRLERALAVNRAYGATAVQAVYALKAAALRRFGGTLGGLLHGLGQLRPPRSSLPTVHNEQRSLQGMRASAAQLADALANGRAAGVPAILRAFDAAAAIPGSRQAQREEIAAVQAYDREIGGLGSLVAQINRERARLANATGGAGI